MHQRLLPLAVLACVTLGCRTGIRPAPPPHAGSLPDTTHWVRNSAEYQALARQTYRLAAQRLEAVAAGRAAGSWAVILDADETVLDNSQYQKELALAGAGFDRESWAAWCRRREARAIPGSRAFLERVHALGGRVAIVTNRRESECADTEAVFRDNALPFDVILCRPDDGPGDKAPRRQRIADGTAHPRLPPLEAVMWVGDNIHDFPGVSQELRHAGPEAYQPFGDVFFLLPNPMYGSWERNTRE